MYETYEQNFLILSMTYLLKRSDSYEKNKLILNTMKARITSDLFTAFANLLITLNIATAIGIVVLVFMLVLQRLHVL